MSDKILFEEQQKFTQWWLWVLLSIPFWVFLYQIIENAVEESVAANTDLSISLFARYDYWLILLCSLFILVAMFLVKMETVIDSKQISVRHLLFVHSTFKWEDIESAEIIKYGFVGYGIRISVNHGTVYNVKGNQGLFLKLKNGKKRLIGTQRPEELNKVIEKVLG